MGGRAPARIPPLPPGQARGGGRSPLLSRGSRRRAAPRPQPMRRKGVSRAEREGTAASTGGRASARRAPRDDALHSCLKSGGAPRGRQTGSDAAAGTVRLSATRTLPLCSLRADGFSQ